MSSNKQNSNIIKLTRKQPSGEEFSIEYPENTKPEESVLKAYLPSNIQELTTSDASFLHTEFFSSTTGRYTIDVLDKNYFSNSYEYTQDKLDTLNLHAQNLPKPTIYGEFSNNKAYIDSVNLLMEASFEREHRDEVIKKAVISKFDTANNCRNILDIGVGSGELSKLIDSHCSFITVIDDKEESLKSIPDIMGRENNKVDKIKGSILEVTIPKKGYDLIVLSHVLYYFNEDNRIELINNLYNLLGEKGCILIVYNDNGDREALAAYFQGKTHNFSKTKAHILEEYTDKYFYQSHEAIKTNNLETMLHIAGVVLNDAYATANEEKLLQYISDNLLHDQIYEIEMTQNILLIGNTRE